MTIARYKTLVGHPAWLYTVELLVQTNGKLIKIATINCKDDEELAQATQWVDHVLQGEWPRSLNADEIESHLEEE